jgi:hypothetical protein
MCLQCSVKWSDEQAAALGAMMAQVEKLFGDERRKARTTLEYYGDQRKYSTTAGVGYQRDPEILSDKGARARAAIGTA